MPTAAQIDHLLIFSSSGEATTAVSAPISEKANSPWALQTPKEGAHPELIDGGVSVCGLGDTKGFRRNRLELVTAGWGVRDADPFRHRNPISQANRE